MTNAALDQLDATRGFEVGVGPSLVVVDAGVGRSITSNTITSDVYAYIFNRNRLMARADIQGSEITRIDTSRIPTRPVNRRGARGVTWQDRRRRGDVPSIRDGGLGIDDRERTLNCEVPTRGWRRTDQARGRHGRMSAIPAPTRRRRKHGEPVGTDLGHQAGVRDVGSRDAAIGPRGVRAARRRVPR